MNGTPTSGFFSDRGNFAEEAKPDILKLAQEAIQQYEFTYQDWCSVFKPHSDETLDVKWARDLNFDATQATLRLGLSIAIDLRRIANALERRHI